MIETNEIHVIKTDVALIKRDITQISQVYKKVDDTLEHMSEIAKTIAVQEKILENDARRILILEDNIVKKNQDELEFRRNLNDKLEELTIRINLDRDIRHKEVMSAIEKVSSSVNLKLEEQSKRTTSLENWKWYVAGIAAIIMFILTKVPWSVIFGS